MLSDSMHDASEEIWAAIKRYDYAADHKADLIAALVEIHWIMYYHDRMECDVTWTKVDMKRHVLKLWDEATKKEE